MTIVNKQNLFCGSTFKFIQEDEEIDKSLTRHILHLILYIDSCFSLTPSLNQGIIPIRKTEKLAGRTRFTTTYFPWVYLLGIRQKSFQGLQQTLFHPFTPLTFPLLPPRLVNTSLKLESPHKNLSLRLEIVSLFTFKCADPAQLVVSLLSPIFLCSIPFPLLHSPSMIFIESQYIKK
jgi:hypothetical protein